MLGSPYNHSMRRVIGTVFSLIAILTIFVLTACSTNKGELRPLHADEGIGEIIGDQPQLVTFSELQADPEAYRDTLIRVTGSFFQLPPPDCLTYSGPGTRWSLISDNLRLDAIGFERSVLLVPPGTELTVDGIFRNYEGPMGCGKRPEVGTAWFLETTRIVQPNPLARTFGTVESGLPPILPPPFASPTIPGVAPPGATATPVLGVSPTPTGFIPTTTPSPATTVIGTLTPTSSPTSGPSIPTTTASPTVTVGPGTPTTTPTSTPTPIPGTPTPSPTNSVPPTPGPTTPPLSTSTPGAYPIPPTPDGSPTGYPGI